MILVMIYLPFKYPVYKRILPKKISRNSTLGCFGRSLDGRPFCQDLVVVKR